MLRFEQVPLPARLRRRTWRLVALCGLALLSAAPAHAALDGLDNDNLPIVLLMALAALVLGIFALKAAAIGAILLFTFIYQSIEKSALLNKEQGTQGKEVFEKENAPPPPLEEKSAGAMLSAVVWCGWVLILGVQCVSLWWRGSSSAGLRHWSLALFWGLLALFVLLLCAQLAARASRKIPQVPAQLRRAVLWFAPFAMTVALVYDTGTRHHLRSEPAARSLSLADMRPLQPAELARLPLAGNLQPGTCQMRLRKSGDPWTQALLTQTVPDKPVNRAGDTLLVLGLHNDGPAFTTQNLSDPRIAGDGIYRSDFQWRLFARNIQTQSAERGALLRQDLAREKYALEQLKAASERQARFRQPDLKDPALVLYEQYAIGLGSDLKDMLLRQDWDCDKKTKLLTRFCQNKLTGLRCQFGQYLGDLCTGSREASVRGKLFSLSNPDTTARIAPSKAWFLWQSAKPMNNEFEAQCAILHSEVIDAGARAPTGDASLMCNKKGNDHPGQAAIHHWIKADLPYQESWISQLPGKRMEIAQLQADRERLAQDAAAAPARLKLIEEAERDLSIAHHRRPQLQLRVRTLKSTPCTPAGQEVCQSFQAVLGDQSEPVVLEERCSDKATAARSSSFNTPMLRW